MAAQQDGGAPGALVSTGWLAERLDDPRLKIVDATYMLPGSGRDAAAEYAARHIPGAVFFDIDGIADPDSTLPHMLPTPQRFAEAVSALGIGDGDLVVAYDGHGLMSAARAWWMFRVFGHDAVAVLDGGLPKWLAEDRPVTDRPTAPVPARFTPRFRPELVRSADEVGQALAAGTARVVDARAAGRFEGTEPEVWPGRRSGHIPGSVNLPYTDLLDRATGTVLPPERLRALFAERGIAPGQPVIASCGSGVTAAVLALARHVTGDPDAAIYDGSWAEWGLRPDLPVETGPAGKGGAGAG